MNWVDVVILAALGFALFSGFQRGAVMQAFGWGGFLVGLVIGSAIAPHIVEAIGPKGGLGKAGIGLAAFLGTAFLVEGLVAAVGLKLRKKITNPGARHADAVIGAAVAMVLSLAASWFLGYQLKRGPSQELARSIQGSTILRAVDEIAPHPPGFLVALGRFLDSSGFPDVFAQLNPSLAPGVEPAPPGIARDPEIVAAAALTFKIESRGCGGVVDGSGFPLDPRSVVTAAHVVAGTSDHKVIEPGGASHKAVVVYLDANKDIAVLRVEGLPKWLLLDADVAGRGSVGAAIGYPGGGKRRTSPARVRAETEALGRDIYSRRLVSRRVYVLEAAVRQGNSGGPFVDDEGHVRGMVFAASTAKDTEAYALSGTEVRRAYGAGKDRTRAVPTGSCAV